MSSDKSSPSPKPSMLVCSICGRRFYLDETDSPPFCSERCKLIDLGRWLDESIQIPHEGGPEQEDHGDRDESE